MDNRCIGFLDNIINQCADDLRIFTHLAKQSHEVFISGANLPAATPSNLCHGRYRFNIALYQADINGLVQSLFPVLNTTTNGFNSCRTDIDSKQRLQQQQAQARWLLEAVAQHPSSAPPIVTVLLQIISQCSMSAGVDGRGHASEKLARLGFLLSILRQVLGLLRPYKGETGPDSATNSSDSSEAGSDTTIIASFLAVSMPLWVKYALQQELQLIDRCARGVKRDRVFLLLTVLYNLMHISLRGQQQGQNYADLGVDSQMADSGLQETTDAYAALVGCCCHTYCQLWLKLYAAQQSSIDDSSNAKRCKSRAVPTVAALMYTASISTGSHVLSRPASSAHAATTDFCSVSQQDPYMSAGDQQQFLLYLMQNMVHPSAAIHTAVMMSNSQTASLGGQRRPLYVERIDAVQYISNMGHTHSSSTSASASASTGDGGNDVFSTIYTPLVKTFVLYYNTLATLDSNNNNNATVRAHRCPEFVAMNTVWTNWNEASATGSALSNALSHYCGASLGVLLKLIRKFVKTIKPNSPVVFPYPFGSECDEYHQYQYLQPNLPVYVNTLLQLYLCVCCSKESILCLLSTLTQTLNRYCDKLSSLMDVSRLGVSTETLKAGVSDVHVDALIARSHATTVLLLLLSALSSHVTDMVYDTHLISRLLLRVCRKSQIWVDVYRSAVGSESMSKSPVCGTVLSLLAVALNVVLYTAIHRLELLEAEEHVNDDSDRDCDDSCSRSDSDNNDNDSDSDNNDAAALDHESVDHQRRQLADAMLPLLALCYAPSSLSLFLPGGVHPVLLYYSELYVLPAITRVASSDACSNLPSARDRLELVRSRLLLLPEARVQTNISTREPALSESRSLSLSLHHLIASMNMAMVVRALPAQVPLAEAKPRVFNYFVHEWRYDSDYGALTAANRWGGSGRIVAAIRPNIHTYLSAVVPERYERQLLSSSAVPSAPIHVDLQQPWACYKELAGTVGDMISLHTLRVHQESATVGGGNYRKTKRGVLLYDDVFRIVLSFCNYRQLCSYSCVSRGFHFLCNQTAVWSVLYRDRFGASVNTAMTSTSVPIDRLVTARSRKKSSRKGQRAASVSVFLDELSDLTVQKAYLNYHLYGSAQDKAQVQVRELAVLGPEVEPESESMSTSSNDEVTATSVTDIMMAAGSASSLAAASIAPATGIAVMMNPVNSNALPDVCEECLYNSGSQNSAGENKSAFASSSRRHKLCRYADRQHDWKMLFRLQYQAEKGRIRSKVAQTLVDSAGHIATVCAVVGCSAILWHANQVKPHLLAHCEHLQKEIQKESERQKKRAAATEAAATTAITANTNSINTTSEITEASAKKQKKKRKLVY